MAVGLDARGVDVRITRARISQRAAVLIAIERGEKDADPSPTLPWRVRTAAAAWPDPCRRGWCGTLWEGRSSALAMVDSSVDLRVIMR